MFDWSLVGAGAGILPYLYKQIMGDKASSNSLAANSNNAANPQTIVDSNGIRTPWNMASLPGGGLSPNGFPLSTPDGQADQAKFGASANTSPVNIVPQSPDQLMGQANQNSNPDLLSRVMSGMKNMGGPLSPMGGSSNGPYTLNSAPIVPPSYAGTGPTPGAAQGMSPNLSMLQQMLPGNIPGAPLGPAASNPLLMMLRQRFGIA